MTSPGTHVGRARGSRTSTGRRWVLSLFALFLLGWTITSIATLPLAPLAPWLEQTTDMRVTATSGSIWRGKVRLAGDKGKIDIHLKFRPSALLRATLEWTVGAQADGVKLKAAVRPSWRAIDTFAIPSLQVDLSADSPWLVEYSPLPIRGQFQLKGTNWRLSPMPREGDWELTWLNAEIALSTPIELGNLLAEGRIEDGRIEGQAHSRPGDQNRSIGLDMRLSGTMDTGLVIEGHLAPSAQSDLPTELNLIGQPTGDGRIHVHLALGNPTPVE